MAPVSTSPPLHFPARWWRMLADGRIVCELCPRACKLRDGQHGFCIVRRRIGDHLELAAYGRSSGFRIAPIENKPLFHFLPGTSALCFGSVGCNLGCRFCANWDLTKISVLGRLSERATPEQIATTASRLGCRSVAFTYNDPVISAEFVIDVAQACHALGLKTVAVTAGYISRGARAEFFDAIDAVNVDLKAIDDGFYRRLCVARIGPVLDTLRFLRRETSVWLEVSTLLIPGENDSDDALHRAAQWFAEVLGPEVPWHLTAYHPDFKLLAPPTPAETLERAREIARSHGLQFVYTGKVQTATGGNTWCPECGRLLIERVEDEGAGAPLYHLEGNRCAFCHHEIPGRFEAGPGLRVAGPPVVRFDER